MTTYNLYCSNHRCFEPATQLIMFASEGSRMGVCDQHARLWSLATQRATLPYNPDETRPLEWSDIVMLKQAPSSIPGRFYKVNALVGWKGAPASDPAQYDLYLQGKLADPRD